jgi:hypothetical protein
MGPAKHLLAHPSLPYVYAVESDLEGISLGCASYEITKLGDGLGSRPIAQRLALTAAGVGFFAADGNLDANLYRFTIAPDGTPNPATRFTSPNLGAIAVVDEPARALFVVGTPEVMGYTLDVNFQLPPAPPTPVEGVCDSPVDAIALRNALAVFCANQPGVQLFSRIGENLVGPPVSAANGIGPFVAVRTISDGTFVAATADQLYAISAGGGIPTFAVGPRLASPPSDLAVSPDGRIVVVARPITTNQSELLVYDASNFALSSTHLVAADVRAIAVTMP